MAAGNIVAAHLSFAQRWSYPQGDPSVSLFDLMVKEGLIDLPIGARVLELGCNETNFACYLKQADRASFVVGIDYSPDRSMSGHDVLQQGDASSAEMLNSLGFGCWDACILLGSLEHFGLGYYGDPVGEHADTLAILNCVQWLKPGGLLYYDVPFDPTRYYITDNRHFRVYDHRALSTRLTPEGMHLIGERWADGSSTPAQLLRVAPEAPMVPYWYVARVLRKAD